MRTLGQVVMVVVAFAACDGREAVAQAPQSPVVPVVPVAPVVQASSTPPPATARRTYAETAKHVVKIACGAGTGSGFVHRSGLVITAAHVIKGCKASGVTILINGSTPTPKEIGVQDIVDTDEVLDLALLRPATKLAPGLAVVDPQKMNVEIGDSVAFIGYPGGYDGAMPMLGVGYLAAVGPYQLHRSQKHLMRAFVNGAFNKGNSGGPVIDLQTQTVLGVVHAKVTPLPADVENALIALRGQNSGFTYSATTVDGKMVTVTEAQVVERVLEHYAPQIQLVVGVMVLPVDLVAFLKMHNL